MSSDPKPRSPGALKRRFPTMFRQPNYGFSFFRGWMPILTWACEEIDAVLGDDKRDFHWEQIKEKFGTARFYYRLGGQAKIVADIHLPDGHQTIEIEPKGQDEVALTVRDIVSKATAATEFACIVCGAQAEVQNFGGYMVNLCTAHQPTGPDDDQWRGVVSSACLGDDDE